MPVWPRYVFAAWIAIGTVIVAMSDVEVTYREGQSPPPWWGTALAYALAIAASPIMLLVWFIMWWLEL